MTKQTSRVQESEDGLRNESVGARPGMCNECSIRRRQWDGRKLARGAKTSMQPGSRTAQIVREPVIRLAESIRKGGAAYPLTSILTSLWVDVFALSNLTSQQIDAVFDEAGRSLKFWPSAAEVLGFISTAEKISNEAKAAMKFEQVLQYIRHHFHPHLGVRGGPRISERTCRAINAAGGLAYLSECSKESLVFARKRFLEEYRRWEELKQDEYLLPDGKVKKLLADTAAHVSVERSL